MPYAIRKSGEEKYLKDSGLYGDLQDAYLYASYEAAIEEVYDEDEIVLVETRVVCVEPRRNYDTVVLGQPLTVPCRVNGHISDLIVAAVKPYDTPSVAVWYAKDVFGTTYDDNTPLTQVTGVVYINPRPGVLA